MSRNHCTYDEKRAEDERYVAKLKKMSVPQLRSELDRRVKEELIASIMDVGTVVSDTVERMIRDVLAASLGLERDYHNAWKLRDDKNPLVQALGDQAFAQMSLALPDFIKSIVDDAGPISLPRLKKEFRRVYHEQAYDHLRELLDAWAEKEGSRAAECAVADVAKDTEYMASLKQLIHEKLPVESSDIDKEVDEEA